MHSAPASAEEWCRQSRRNSCSSAGQARWKAAATCGACGPLRGHVEMVRTAG